MEEAGWEGASREGVKEERNGGRTTGRTGCAHENNGRLFLVPGWGGSVDTGDTSEWDPGGKIRSLLYVVLNLRCLSETRRRSHKAAGWAAGRAGRKEAGTLPGR